MRYLITAALILSCSLCLAEDLPENTYEIKSLTAEQAAKLVANEKGRGLYLSGLTSIDKDVAQELGKFKGELTLRGLTSIDNDVAQELAKCKAGLTLGLTSINKDVAQELAKVKGDLNLYCLTSIDKDVLKILKAKPGIMLPEKYRGKKD